VDPARVHGVQKNREFMMRRRITSVLGTLLVCVTGSIALIAQNSTSPVQATDKPFLWRIEGAVPSYLYGTVHVPDPRVLELPEVVRRAFDTTDVFNAEIPLDAGTQAGLMTKVTLPPGQDLRKIVGEDVFARLVRAITKPWAGLIPPGAADLVGMTLSPLKPWAAMSQLELLEYMPDILAGRQPLDATLYSMATSSRKEVGGLETVDEQVAVFEGFTINEQVRMLVSTLDDIEKPRPAGMSAARELVDLYLAGDLNALARELADEYPDDPALKNKMTSRVIDDRNTKMTARIAERIAKKPARSYFFAVGALHYAGDTGIISQLTKKGFKITRLTPRDAASIVRKPAA
jgi:uncharacterized protein YbaP (TraB family)